MSYAKSDLLDDAVLGERRLPLRVFDTPPGTIQRLASVGGELALVLSRYAFGVKAEILAPIREQSRDEPGAASQ
jgi:hypothetical protein